MKIAKLMLLVLLVSSVLITGCAKKEEKVLNLWTMFTGADGTTFTEMVDAYNATNPEYKVNHQPITAEDLYLRLQLAVSSGEGIPDIAVNHIERLALFQEDKRITDLTPYLSQSPIKKENYIASAWQASQIAGGQYGVPLDVHSYVLYVNWDLYTKYSLTDLDDKVLTWDEVIRTAPTVMRDGIIPIGLGWLRVIFLASYAQAGGVLSANGTDPSFDNEIARNVLRHYTNLVNNGLSQRAGEDSWRMFLGGEVLYMPEGIWMFNDVRQAGLNTKSFDFPVFDANKVNNWTSSHQFTIPARKNVNQARVAASLQFINWIGEHSEAWAFAGQLPAHRGGQTANARTLPQAFLADHTGNQLYIYNYKYYGYAVDALDAVLGDIFFGNISVEDGLKRAEQEVKDKIAFNN